MITFLKVRLTNKKLVSINLDAIDTIYQIEGNQCGILVRSGITYETNKEELEKAIKRVSKKVTSK